MNKLKFNFSKTAKVLFLAMLVIPFLSTCKKDDPDEPKSSNKELLTVTIKAGGATFNAEKSQSNPNVFEFLVPYEHGGTIFIQETLKTATIELAISEKATSEPAHGSTVDLFTGDLTITVTPEDESTPAQYTIKKIDGTSDKKDFVTFEVIIGKGVTGEYKETNCVIDNVNKIVYIPRPDKDKWELLEKVEPTFTLSNGATASPETGVLQSFSEIVTKKVTITVINPETEEEEEVEIEVEERILLEVEYTITAHDLSEAEWTVAIRGSDLADVDIFLFDIYKDNQDDYDWRGDVQIEADIDPETRTITFDLPILPSWFTPAKMFVFPAAIQISPGATVSPDWNEPQDFTKDVVYTVTAEDGETQKTWTVKAPPHYFMLKWDVAYQTYDGEVAGDSHANPNAIGILGNYLALARSNILINKSNGTQASESLNIDGVIDHHEEAAGANRPWPFFFTNDDKGNMIGSILGNWNANNFTLFKWTSPTAPPVVLKELPVVKDGVKIGNFGRKVQVLGDIDGNGLIISSNAMATATGGHAMWKINGGVIDENPILVETGRMNNSNAYQLITPLGILPEGPYYIGSPQAGRSEDNNVVHPQLQFGDIGNVDNILGPFGALNGWGDLMYLWHKLFTFNGKNYIATLTGNWTSYHFAVSERNTNVDLITRYTDITPFSTADNSNGNATGSFAIETVGNDVFFYLFTTNKYVRCYHLAKF